MIPKKTMRALPRIEKPIEDTIFISEIAEGSKLDLLKINFAEDTDRHSNKIKNVTFKECVFSHQLIENITFLGCTFIKCQFNGAQIKNSELHKCKFEDSCLYKTNFENTYVDPNSFKFTDDWRKYWSNVNAWLFQNLYRNSKNMHQEKFAMHADNKFLFYRRYEHLYGKTPSKAKFIKGFLFDWLLGNGYGIKNTIITSLIFIAAFTLSIKDSIKQTENQNLIDAFYLAIVSFTTVGYGDITPQHEPIAILATIIFLIFSAVWGAVMTAIIIKRIVK